MIEISEDYKITLKLSDKITKSIQKQKIVAKKEIQAVCGFGRDNEIRIIIGDISGWYNEFQNMELSKKDIKGKNTGFVRLEESEGKETKLILPEEVQSEDIKGKKASITGFGNKIIIKVLNKTQ